MSVTIYSLILQIKIGLKNIIKIHYLNLIILFLGHMEDSQMINQELQLQSLISITNNHYFIWLNNTM